MVIQISLFTNNVPCWMCSTSLKGMKVVRKTFSFVNFTNEVIYICMEYYVMNEAKHWNKIHVEDDNSSMFISTSVHLYPRDPKIIVLMRF